MMNALAIALVVASLASAGVWSPPLENHDDDVIVKEGHRVVVVEYDQDGNPNTKVSISPDHDLRHHEPAEDDDAADRSKESGYQGPKELICDAFGKCKHRIASAFGRVKEEAAEKVHEAEEAAREAKDVAEEKIGKVKEAVSQKTHEARDSVRSKVDSAKDAAKDAVRSVKEGVSESAESAGERLRETARDAKVAAEEKARDVKAAAESVSSRAKRMKDFGERHLRRHLGLDALSGLLNLVGFVTAYGMCVWVTFVSSYVLASTLPRHQFGLVQSKIYPVYFRAMVYGVGATLLGHLLSRRKLLGTSQPDVLQAYNLLAAILTVLINMLYLEPRATKVMMEKLKLEKEEGRGRDLGAETRQGTGIRRTDVVPPTTATPAAETTPVPATGDEDREAEVVRSRVRRLNERLRKLNSYSSLLNVMSLMALTWHLVYLSQRLARTC